MAKVLWIEDDYERIKRLTYFLVEEGHTILNATTKLGSFKVLEENKDIDIIILDLILPEGDESPNLEPYPGFKILDKVRLDLKLGIPIIVLTVVRDPDILNKLEPYKITKILKKGVFKASELQKEVNKALVIARDKKS